VSKMKSTGHLCSKSNFSSNHLNGGNIEQTFAESLAKFSKIH
jgi:hypothetical protein